MDIHNATVAAIAARVKYFHSQHQPFRIFHGSTNSTRASTRTSTNTIDISSLSNILFISSSCESVLVEPNVPMDRLVAATLAHGLVPPVVMEFPGITAGGGFSGTSGESSSFRYGLFHRTVRKVEMVLADGSVVMASEDERKDLFTGAAEAYGTLGIVTMLEIRLVEARTYVKLTYLPVVGVDEAVKVFEEQATDESVDYLDGIMFWRTSGVVMIGRLSNDILASDGSYLPIQTFTKASNPWFYVYAQQQLRHPSLSASPSTVAIPLIDYLFRYNRGCFWMGKYTFNYFLTPCTAFTRWLYDSLMHTRVLYHMLHQSGHADRLIVQDIGVPYENAGALAEFLTTEFRHYPLWLCPLKIQAKGGASPMTLRSTSHYSAKASSSSREKKDPDRMLLNFGVWGPGPGSLAACTELNRAIERKILELHGMKWLYAHVHYNEQEFWQMYNKGAYDALREEYGAAWMPSVWEKVRVKGSDAIEGEEGGGWLKGMKKVFWQIWPLSGLYGVVHAVVCTDYLMKSGIPPNSSVVDVREN